MVEVSTVFVYGPHGGLAYSLALYPTDREISPT